MIIDLDAHQGNGHERDFMNEDRVFIFDVYNRNIYPQDGFAKRAIKWFLCKNFVKTSQIFSKFSVKLNFLQILKIKSIWNW